jgi:hypothetical protein
MTGSCQYKFKQKIDKNNMQKCSICIHLKRKEIDEALLISPLSLRDIAGQYKVSKSALQRHKEDHMPLDLIKTKMAGEICRAEGLLNKLISLKNDAERIAKKAESDDDLKTALAGIREQSRIIEILAKMQGQIQQPQINLTTNNFALLKIHDRLSRKLEGIIETNG